MNLLNQILEQKRKEITTLKLPEDCLKQPKYSLIEYLKKDTLQLIAEVKQASPSKGQIYKTFDPIKLATKFEKGGASCISVLTDQNSLRDAAHLINVKKNVTIPVLRKDFIIDPIQVKESSLIGADVVLLILDALSDQQANELIDCANAESIEVLLEIHDIETLDRLNNIKNKPIVGINNRNLITFECNINHALNLKKTIKDIDPSIKVIAESGYFNAYELDALEKNNINGVLIGEGLSKKKELLNWFSNEN